MIPTHRIQMTVTDGPIALDRIVSTCRTRRCPIVSLRFSAGDRHRAGQVALEIEAAPERARLLAGRLGGLVEVLDIGAYSPPDRLVSQPQEHSWI